MPTQPLSYPAVTRQPTARGASLSSALPKTAELLVQLLVFASTAAAPALALVDAFLRPRRTARLARALRRERLRPWSELRRIWLARTLREALRFACAVGLERAALRRVVLRGNVAALRQPAVLAVYHSPWGRLLGRWLSRSGEIVLLADAQWSARATGAHAASTPRGMRQLLRGIERGRSAAVTIDHFWERGRLARGGRLLGSEVVTCMGAARLAARAGVPLVPVSFRWTGAYLEINLGHAFIVTRETIGAATARLLTEFDAAVRADLASWANAHQFLSRTLPRLRTPTVD